MQRVTVFVMQANFRFSSWNIIRWCNCSSLQPRSSNLRVGKLTARCSWGILLKIFLELRIDGQWKPHSPFKRHIPILWRISRLCAVGLWTRKNLKIQKICKMWYWSKGISLHLILGRSWSPQVIKCENFCCEKRGVEEVGVPGWRCC